MSARKTDLERLADALAMDDNGCLIWTGHIAPNGYGRVRQSTLVTGYVHRKAYEILVGPIPEGYEIDHLCRIRACALPDHLEAVTPQINTHRRALTKTTCKQGHPLPPAVPGVWRRCRVCARAFTAAYRARKSAEAAA